MGRTGRGRLGTAPDPARRGRLGPAALGLFALVGVANAVLDVGQFTALQRVLPAAAIGRALGVLETVVLVGIGLGAALAPALTVTDVRGCSWGRPVPCRRRGGGMARHRPHRPGLPVPGPSLPPARAPMFAPTARHRRISRRLQQAHFDEGAVIIRKVNPAPTSTSSSRAKRSYSVQGRPCARWVQGTASERSPCSRRSPHRDRRHPRRPRTVTLHRTEFLAALANVESATAADALVRGRLQAGSWPERQQTPGATEQ